MAADPGYGAPARLTALLQEETEKAREHYEKPDRFQQSVFPQIYSQTRDKDRRLVKTLRPGKLYVRPGNERQYSDYLRKKAGTSVCSPSKVKDAITLYIQHDDCKAYACITFKVTMNPKSRTVHKSESYLFGLLSECFGYDVHLGRKT